MDRELSAASDFLASYLAHSHSQFSQNLAQVLAERYDGHWFPAEPERGSAYRALVRSQADLDHSILAAARQAGVPLPELERALTRAPGAKRVELGDRWTLWIDPGCVSLRVERGDPSAATARDAGRFIEIFGKLPDSLRSLVVPLERAGVATTASTSSSSSSNIPGAADLPPPASPVKRTRAVQIVAPPGGRNALQAMTNAALQPDSPAPRPKPTQPATALLASPLIIPPTPVRPLPAAEADVFSPTPAASSGRTAAGESSLLVPPRSPSPLSASSAGSAGAGKKLGHSLSPLSLRPSSPLGSPIMDRQRRSLSRDSSASSMSAGSSDDGELSACDSIFSTGADSTTSSAASSVHALTGATTIWKGLDAKSRDLVDADGFRIPARPSVSGHARNASSSSLAPPPSPGSRHLFSPSSASSSSSATARSAPNSPSKPRRRGVRGGQGHRSAESGHGRSSSISSVTSLGSTAVPSTPSQSQSQAQSDSGSATTRATTPSGRSSSFSHERSPSANTVATEYSNGLVKVLGGGVLLGCAKSTSSTSSASNGHNRDGTARTPSSGSGATAGEEGSRRRRRERGRGGRGGNGNGREHDRSGATSPFQPVSPNWIPHASPFHQQGQMYHYHGSYPNSPYNHGYPQNLPPSPMQ